MDVSEKPLSGKKTRRLAILDMGSNTFNLLVADVLHGKLETVCSEKLPVLLGQGLHRSGRISDLAAQRGLEAMRHLLNTAKQSGATQVFGLATAAMREAQNGMELAQLWSRQTDCPIRIVSGEEEARLICKGVAAQYPLNQIESGLVVDIGGGSTECIAFSSGKTDGLFSFKCGVVRMLEAWEPQNPACPQDLDRLWDMHEQIMHPLLNFSSHFKPKVLIGSSGFFDTLSDLDATENGTFPKGPQPYIMSVARFMDWQQRIRKSTLEERLTWNAMPPFRAPYAVVSAEQTGFLMAKFDIPELACVRYALKEGALLDAEENLPL